MLQSPVATGGSVVGTGVGGGADVLVIPLDRLSVKVEQVRATMTRPTISSGIRFRMPIWLLVSADWQQTTSAISAEFEYDATLVHRQAMCFFEYFGG